VRALVVILGTACVHSVAEVPVPTVASWQGTVQQGRWWTSIPDPELGRLIDVALAGNLSLQQAEHRLAQAEGAAGIARATWFPSFVATPAAGWQHDTASGQSATAWSGSVAAAYEVDLWGKLRHQREAAQLGERAARHRVTALAMTLSASVAESWYGLAALRQQLALLARQRHTAETFLALVETRFKHGLAGSADVLQQRALVHTLAAQESDARAQAKVMENQLALLSGQEPNRVHMESALLPTLGPAPAPAASLLEQRPDVLAAREAVLAADHDVGAALADLYPSLTLSLSISNTAAGLADLVSDALARLAATFGVTLFRGGAKAYEVDRRRAVLAERLGAFRETVLTALVEVQDALAREAEGAEEVARLQAGRDDARLAEADAEQRYRNGLAEFLRVLSAAEAVHRAEGALLQAERRRISSRIQLHRALGGPWSPT
jgi:NodT family efflux transporter outer membrane factor (OMF) lipoprotein